MELNFFAIVDKLATNYGWSIEYIQNLSMDEINGLVEVMNEREADHYKLLSYIQVLAFSGKTIDNILDKKVPGEISSKKEEAKQIQQKKDLVRLFGALGMKSEDINKGIKKGKLSI